MLEGYLPFLFGLTRSAVALKWHDCPIRTCVAAFSALDAITAIDMRFTVLYMDCADRADADADSTAATAVPIDRISPCHLLQFFISQHTALLVRVLDFLLEDVQFLLCFHGVSL